MILSQAALNYATVPVLTLAYQCKKEAEQISSESVRQQLEKKFEEGLKSEKLDEFTLAAEVRLASRLNELNHDLSQSNREIDTSYITHAEYQLFWNETNSPTNSPTTPANKRDVEQPITNINFWDANRFCAWLSLRTRKELGEPGICYKPATQAEKQQHPCEEDKKYADKEGIRLIRFQVPTRYAQLAYYLAAGEWKEADEETNKVMLEVAGGEKQGYLELEDIRQFPCEDLRIIDKLWVEYSNGHFNVSI
ncbi:MULTISPECIES: GUN4 domain-containing protein [Brasilonema]|uniref:GUN4 domain-containing protein n=1 Tax=Brasilonema TaxID=383614 RepID=UPI00145E4D11|nr:MULTISPECIES: GUN4 domain-containing protein [Brasilonema]